MCRLSTSFQKNRRLEVCLLVPKAYTRPSRAYWHLQGTYQAEWNVLTCFITLMNTHVLWCYCTRICVFSGRQWARLQQASSKRACACRTHSTYLSRPPATHPPCAGRGVGGPARRGGFFAALLAIRPNPPLRVRFSKNKTAPRQSWGSAWYAAQRYAATIGSRLTLPKALEVLTRQSEGSVVTLDARVLVLVHSFRMRICSCVQIPNNSI